MENQEVDYSRNAPEALVSNGMKFVFYTVPQVVADSLNNIPQFYFDLESKDNSETKPVVRLYVRFEPQFVEFLQRGAVAEACSTELIAYVKKHFRKYNLKPTMRYPNAATAISELLHALDLTETWVQAQRVIGGIGPVLVFGDVHLNCHVGLTFKYSNRREYMDDPTLAITEEREDSGWDNLAAAGYTKIYGFDAFYWVIRNKEDVADIEGNEYRKFFSAQLIEDAVNQAIGQSFDKYGRDNQDPRKYVEDLTLLSIATF